MSPRSLIDGSKLEALTREVIGATPRVLAMSKRATPDAGSVASRKRPNAAEPDPNPSKKQRKPKKMACARCGALQGTTPWVTETNDNGDDVDVGAGCKRCYAAWHAGWKHHVEWPELCGQCHEDPAFAAAFEESCACLDNLTRRSWPEQNVAVETKSGYRAKSNLIFIREHEFKALTKGVPTAAAKVQLHRLDGPFGRGVVGVLAQHPDKPYMEVEVFHEVTAKHAEEHMLAKNMVRKDQAQEALELVKKNLAQTLPVPLRGNTKVQTLPELLQKVAAMRKASGGVDESDGDESSEAASEGAQTPRSQLSEVPEAAAYDDNDSDASDASQALVAPSSKVAAPTASNKGALGDASKTLPSMESKGDPRATSPGGGARKRRGSGSVSQEASSAATSSRANLEGRFERVASRAKERSTEAAETPPSAKKGQPAKAVAEVDGDMARARELVDRCKASAVLAGQSLGDHVYAASRFLKKRAARPLRTWLRRLSRSAASPSSLQLHVCGRWRPPSVKRP